MVWMSLGPLWSGHTFICRREMDPTSAIKPPQQKLLLTFPAEATHGRRGVREGQGVSGKLHLDLQVDMVRSGLFFFSRDARQQLPKPSLASVWWSLCGWEAGRMSWRLQCDLFMEDGFIFLLIYSNWHSRKPAQTFPHLIKLSARKNFKDIHL